MTTLQRKLDWLFDAYLDHKLTQEEYANEVDSFTDKRRDEVQHEFGYRIDRRSLGEFAFHLIDQMEIEKNIINHWVRTIGYDFFKGEATFEYSGIESEARLVCESSTTKEDMKRPDVEITLCGIDKSYLEIKQCPVLYKATYKTSDLKHYHSLEEDVYMLTAHTKGKFSPEKVDFYTLLTPDGLAKLLEDGRRGVLKSEKRREMGYKKAVQFTREGLEDYFLIQECK